ncbi:ki-ras-induced actin-interacting protein-IP3R-interacting domain olf186-M [Tachypleus tridentatus]|uniref:ki-ras-induced actin-interacting protein-IP3R-interacting domain olf186-M n=1 Tax=Tachypleus tridentatus TaxID=6853 RepID=UPI003FD3EB35
MKSVLNILRSNLGPEEKLLAIKQKHDYWKQFNQTSVLQKQEKDVQNEKRNNCLIEVDRSIRSPVKQEQILSNSVNDNIDIKKTALFSEDFSILDSNVKKHQSCLNEMKTSTYSSIENGGQTNMTKKFNVPAKLDGTDNVACPKRRQDSTIQGEEIHYKSANMTKKELKSILKIDVDRLSVEQTIQPQKSPVTVQEWVNSIQLAPGEESRSVGEKQNIGEQLPRSQTEKITPDVSFSPTEQLQEGSFDDNLYLGAEARNLDGVLKEAAINRMANSLSPQSRRMSFGDLQSKQNSFNSDFSSYSGISSLSSVESLLEARRGDPEEVLLALGFGGKPPNHPISRVPKRFLLQPSQAKGVKVEDFLKHQEYLLARRESRPLEFLGVSSQFILKQQYLRRTCRSSCSLPQVARVSSLELHSTHPSHSGQSENNYKQKKVRKSTVTFLDEIDPNQYLYKIPHISVTNPQNVTNLELSDKLRPSESSETSSPQNNTWWNKFVYSSDVVISNSSNFSYSSSDTHTISSSHRVVRSSLV